MNNADKPACPINISTIEKSGYYAGLTKRELFAIKAMQGLLANQEDNNRTNEVTARIAVQLADDLLKALSTEPKKEGEGK